MRSMGAIIDFAITPATPPDTKLFTDLNGLCSPSPDTITLIIINFDNILSLALHPPYPPPLSVSVGDTERD